MRINHLTIAVLASLFSLSTANASLLSRASGAAYYDTSTNVTWLADANLSVTSGYCGVPGNCADSGGSMTWTQAQSWIASLNTGSGYLGVTGWRLPATLEPDPSCTKVYGGFNCTGSEMGELFYSELGGIAGSWILGTHNSNYDLFSNLYSFGHWSGTTDARSPNYSAWYFTFYDGNQDTSNFSNLNFAWALRSGDIAAVPVPAAAWLFGSGLAALCAARRRRLLVA